MDEVERRLWPKVQAAEVKAIDAWIRLQQRRSALLGLDLTPEVHLAVATGPTLIVADPQISPEVIAEIEARQSAGELEARAAAVVDGEVVESAQEVDG
jgi:hypothetical protein